MVPFWVKVVTPPAVVANHVGKLLPAGRTCIVQSSGGSVGAAAAIDAEQPTSTAVATIENAILFDVDMGALHVIRIPCAAAR
jgi:hypothetical protein